MQYHIYGLHLNSDMLLPELRSCPAPREPDVVFDLAPVSGTFPKLPADAHMELRKKTNLGSDLLVYRNGLRHILRLEGLAQFSISANGGLITCFPLSNASASFIRSMLFGAILSYVLHLKGVANLHASVVSLPSGAVGFLAEPGRGKSTLAAAFIRQGYPLLSDDILAIRGIHGKLLAMPGFPWVSITPQVLKYVRAGLGRNGVEMDFDKARVPVDGMGGSFCPQPLPLRALYLLERNDKKEVEICSLSAPVALRELLEHTNCLPLLSRELVRQSFDHLAPVVASIPVHRLRYPSGLALIPSVIKAIVENSVASPIPAEAS